MGLATCTYRGCENPPSRHMILCRDHLQQQSAVISSLSSLRDAHRSAGIAQANFVRRVREAREAGATWAEIGRALGKSRQYAQRKYGTKESEK